MHIIYNCGPSIFFKFNFDAKVLFCYFFILNERLEREVVGFRQQKKIINTNLNHQTNKMYVKLFHLMKKIHKNYFLFISNTYRFHFI